MVNKTYVETESNKVLALAERLTYSGIEVLPGYYNFVHFYPLLSELPFIHSINHFSDIFDPSRMEETVALYIHIPFCSSSCRFCHYSKRIEVGREEVIKYLNYLEREIKYIRETLGDRKIHSIYVGGGSPSYLEVDEIESLMTIIHSNFDLSNIVEFTYEAEPNTLDKKKIEKLIDFGVDRLSVGLQSFNDNILRYYNRAHSGAEALAVTKLLNGSNLRTVNIDFIYGLKGQNMDDVRETLAEISLLLPPSITYYQLWGIGHDDLLNATWNDKIEPINNIVTMKQLINEQLQCLGYESDNLCWFVKGEDHKCCHFHFRWSDRPYIGIGQSAYSYIDGVAYQNARNYSHYYELLNQGVLPIMTGKVLKNSERATRAVILGLKMNDGVSLSEIRLKYGVSMTKESVTYINRLLEMDCLTQENNKIKFTKEGVFWGDCVLSNLLQKNLFTECS